MIGPIRDRRTFEALRARGIRVRRGALAATYLAEDEAPGTRVAFAITKRVGGAVARNRLRRRLRAVIVELDRTGAPTVPTGALLIAAGPEAVDRDAEELRNDVQRLLAALEDRREGGSGR